MEADFTAPNLLLLGAALAELGQPVFVMVPAFVVPIESQEAKNG